MPPRVWEICSEAEFVKELNTPVVGVTIEIVKGIVVIVITSMFVRNYLVKKYKKEEPEPIKKISLGFYSVRSGNNRFLVMGDYSDHSGKTLRLLFSNEINVHYTIEHIWLNSTRICVLSRMPRFNMDEAGFNYMATHTYENGSALTIGLIRPNYNHWVLLEAKNYKVETGWGVRKRTISPHEIDIPTAPDHMWVDATPLYVARAAVPVS